MRPPTGLAFLFGGGFLLLFAIFLLPHASAQLPSTNVSAPQGFAVSCPDAFVQVDYLGSTQTTCTIFDMTKDSLNGNGAPVASPGAVQHIVTVSLANTTPSGFHGWVVQPGTTFFSLYGGQTAQTTITIQTTPKIDTPDFSFALTFAYSTPSGFAQNLTAHFQAKVAPYSIGYLKQDTFRIETGQAKVVQFHMELQNLGVFPDVYQVSIQAPEDLQVGTPGAIYVPPLTTKNVSVSVLTPHGKLLDLGTTYNLGFTAVSLHGGGAYTQAGSIFVSGMYVPTYWIPLTFVGAIAGVIVATKSRDAAERRRLERGTPRRAVLSPRQEVLLAELKEEDPDAYKARRAELVALDAQRRAQYKGARREQLSRDRDERAKARAEYKAAKARRAEEKRAGKRAQAQARKAATKASKLQGKEDKVKAKQLRKTQKKLENARGKQAKVDAKQAAKDAKAQAKTDKAAQAQAKADARAAKKAAKEAAKSKDEPGAPPPGGQ